MKDDLQGKLVEILTSIQAAAGKASDFAMEQLPDIAQSYIVYGRFVETMQAAIALVIFFGCIAAVCWAVFISKSETSYGTWGEGRGFMLGAGVLGGFISFAGVLIEGPQAALVWFAPKVWLLKEIAGMIK